MILNRILSAAALTSGMMISGGAFAATMATCPDIDVGITDYELTVSSGTVSCLAWGDTNFQSSDLDAVEVELGYELTLVDKSDDGTSGTDPDAFDIITGSLTGGSSGSFDVDTSEAFDNWVVVFKTGGGQNDPDWSAFLVSDILADFSWVISNEGGGTVNALSHVDLYGGGTTVIPLPAAGWLLLGGLGGIAALRRRRKT